MRSAAWLVSALLVCGCASQAAETDRPVAPTSRLPTPSPIAVMSPRPMPSPEPTPSSAPTPSPYLYVAIVQSDYGFVSVQTAGGAVCTATATLPNGHQAGGLRNPQTAGADGMVSWVYPQPPTDEGTGTHRVSCSKGGLGARDWAYFEIGS